MRLSKYLSLSSDNNNTTSFRSLSINMVETETNNLDIIEQIDDITGDVSELLDRANKQLKSVYRGKMKFDLCIDEEGSMPDEVKMDSSKLPKVKDIWFRFNDELSEIQNRFEEYLNSNKH